MADMMCMSDIPPDGLLTPDGRAYVTGVGETLCHVHNEEDCAGRACVVHAPSMHTMRDFPTHFRPDRYLMERICPHGIGHPDPDDVAFHASYGKDESIHGCCGCCGVR